ncbi:hypothetical protein [uncultured Sulfitobacter sp.]|uniref:hypothetical protein n=1 Tax=uncultured Sulfitobacter sp. TaxID=191468 RepID=UPI002625AF97|nr:hypothetical protein [uncultured Sulfitobacter sp.]
MLARIAQREISRHVEAREDDGRIVLSAQELAGTAVATRSRKADVEETSMEASADMGGNETPVTADEAREIREATADTAKADRATETDENAARIDGDETVDTAPAGVTTDEDIDEETVDDPVIIVDTAGAAQAVAPQELHSDENHTHEATQSADADEEAEHADAAAADIVPALPDADVEAFFSESTTDSSIELDEDAEEARAISAASNSIAEKLKRIRAVVSQQSVAADTPDYVEDQHADTDTPDMGAPDAAQAGPKPDLDGAADAVEVDAPDLAERQNDVVSATLRDIEDALDADDAAEPPTSNRSESEDDEDQAGRVEDTDNAQPDEDGVNADSDENILASLAGYDDDLTDADDDLDELPQETADTQAGQDRLTDAASEEYDDNLFYAEQPAGETEGAATPPPVEVAKPAPRTRVLKVKRATLEAAIKRGELEEYYDDDDEIDAAESAEQSHRAAPLAERSSLSDAEEDELARELAELEAEMNETPKRDAEAALPPAHDRVSTTPAGHSQSVHADMSPNADEDFSRLMAETDQQMEEPESATRRDAFTHLRAAVVAKKADEAVAGKPSETEADEAYRDDLANVVKPRRPSTTERARTTERPAEQRPAPLRLVAEQRIDVQTAAAAGPVRPRRIASITGADRHDSVDDEGGFEDFVDEVGAHKLPDLLEAAAAYIAFVEGQQNFSRPQLMNKVRQVEKDNFTREDGLRSFGKLLREGKIEKLKGGRFQVSEQIGFKPDARAAS